MRDLLEVKCLKKRLMNLGQLSYRKNNQIYSVKINYLNFEENIFSPGKQGDR